MLTPFVLVVTPVKKKRGRPPKQQVEDSEIQEEEDEAEAAKKAKRALNRFNGMTVAEVMAKTLPDVITYNLDILIVSCIRNICICSTVYVDDWCFFAVMV